LESLYLYGFSSVTAVFVPSKLTALVERLADYLAKSYFYSSNSLNLYQTVRATNNFFILLDNSYVNDD
jgi:hypothetical protein